MDRSAEVKAAAEKLHDDLAASGVDVMLDDRGERPGAMFADWELIGVPHRIVISDRGLKEGQLEYQHRRDAAATKVPAARRWPSCAAGCRRDHPPGLLAAVAGGARAVRRRGGARAVASSRSRWPIRCAPRSRRHRQRAPPEPEFATTEARMGTCAGWVP
jgi:hypothetical protein